MKGIATTVIIGVLMVVLSIVLLMVFVLPYLSYSPDTSDSTYKPESEAADTYDYAAYLLGDATVMTDECTKLKNAVKYAMMTGRPFIVDDIAVGSDLVSREDFPLIGNCPDEDITVEIGEGLYQKVCTFKRITTNSKVYADKGGLSDMTLLNYANCNYRFDTYSIMPTFSPYVTLGLEAEIINTTPNTINTYYSPDYLYIRDGDYVHYPGPTSSMNATAFNNAYPGAGRLKIYVGNATTINGECKFNVYFCPQTAIATNAAESSMDVFRIFRDLEIYNTYALPYYIRDVSDSVSGGVSTEAYYWNFYDIDLDRNYDVETIINAIKSGLYSNVVSRGYFFAQPHWDIEEDSRISLYDSYGGKTGECWNTDYDDAIKSGSPWSHTRSIRFDCGDNGCDGTLRIKIAIRKDHEEHDIDGDGENDDLTYVSGIISFCDIDS